MQLKGLDLAMVVACNAGGIAGHTVEMGEEVIHSVVIMGRVGGFFIAADKESLDDCWIGRDTGTFPLSLELVDAVDAEQGAPGAVHGVVEDGEVRLQVRSSVRPEDLSVSSFLELVEEHFRQSMRLKHRILGPAHPGLAPGKLVSPPALAMSATETIVSSFHQEWRRILRHGGHRTRLGIPLLGASRSDFAGDLEVDSYTVSSSGWFQAGPTPFALTDSSDLFRLSAALESACPPDFLALREVEGKVLACGAIGAFTFAVEDEADLTRAVSVALRDCPKRSPLDNAPSPSGADLVSGYFGLAHKFGHAFPRNVRHLDEGWHRPLSVWISSQRKQIQVKTGGTPSEMVVDVDMSRAATALLTDPQSREVHRRFRSSLEQWFTAAEAERRR